MFSERKHSTKSDLQRFEMLSVLDPNEKQKGKPGNTATFALSKLQVIPQLNVVEVEVQSHVASTLFSALFSEQLSSVFRHISGQHRALVCLHLHNDAFRYSCRRNIPEVVNLLPVLYYSELLYRNFFFFFVPPTPRGNQSIVFEPLPRQESQTKEKTLGFTGQRGKGNIFLLHSFLPCQIFHSSAKMQSSFWHLLYLPLKVLTRSV